MIKRILIAASLLLSCLAPASAQFADQATFAGTGAGSINAQTVTLANVSQYSDLQGVIMKYIPGASGGTVNTTDATLNVNTLGAIHFRKPGPNGSGLITLTGSELVNGQGVWIMYDGTYFELLSGYTNSVGAANLSNSSLQFGVPVNLQLNATVATNALTVAVKGNNGSDPSSSNPVLIPFRDSTIANGDPKIVSLQAALSFTISSGSTMGCVSGQMCRLWLYAICSTGLECTNSAGSDVVGLCAYNARSGSTLVPVDESQLQTSASGTGGGNSAQTLYCNISAVTARAVRTVGYVDIQETTAGTWASGPTVVQLFGPGIKKAGDIVRILTITGGGASGSPPYPSATTIAQGITLASAANAVIADASVSTAVSGGGVSITIGIYRVTSGTFSCSAALGPSTVFQPTSTGSGSFSQSLSSGLDFPGTASLITYGVCWGTTVGTGNQTNQSLKLMEIQGAADMVPDNDNDPRLLNMVG